MTHRTVSLCAVVGLALVAAFTLSACKPGSSSKTYTHQLFDRTGDHVEQLERGATDSSVTHVDDIRDVQRFVVFGATSVTAVRYVDGQSNVFKIMSLDPCGQVYIVTDVATSDSIWAQQRYTSVPNSRTDAAVTMIHVHNLDEVLNVNVAPTATLSYTTPSY